MMDARRWADACGELRVAVEAAGLGEAWKIKPLLSGRDVMERLGMRYGQYPSPLTHSLTHSPTHSLAHPLTHSLTRSRSGGPVLGTAMSRLMEWQLENPEADRDACLHWLDTSLRAELGDSNAG